jgi:glutaredoxin-related protein
VISSFQKEIVERGKWEVDVALSMSANLKKFFHEKEGLKDFSSVDVVIEDKRYVVVPIELFDDEQTEFLFYQNLPECENETILCDMLQSMSLTVVFGIDKSVYQQLGERFAKVRYHSHISSLIEYFAARSHQGNNKKMFVNLRSEAIDVICLDRGHLLLANTYLCTEANDRLYYIMYVWRQIQLDQEQDELSLLGNVPQKEQLVELLDKYIRHRYIFDETKMDDIKRFAL